MGSILGLFNLTLLSATLRVSVPLVLAGLCYVICARAGVTDMGLEGKMLFAAFMAVLFTDLTGSPFLGALGAMLSTAVVSYLMGLVLIKLHAQQVIVGIGLNFLMQGITAVLMVVVWENPGSSASVSRLSSGLPDLFAKIPVIGDAFAMQTPILFIALLMVAAAHVFLFYTRAGLRMRSVGENPMAADSLGINVQRYRIAACVVGGMLCGLAGADLTIGQLGYFARNMTSGRGYIALACGVVGRFKPSGMLLTALLIALVDALQVRLQTLFNLPPQFFQIVPYVVPIIVISCFGGVKGPDGMGKPYRRGER